MEIIYVLREHHIHGAGYVVTIIHDPLNWTPHDQSTVELFFALVTGISRTRLRPEHAPK